MTLPYERINNSIFQAIGTVDGEFVIHRSAFRWLKEDGVISSAYEMLSLETVCADNNWEIVCQFGESLAVVKRKS